MAREKKVGIIDELQEIFSKCDIGVLTDYRGLSAAEINGLRRQLRESSISYRVVKNTLARFAAERAGKNELSALFEGPIAIAFSNGEVTEPAKVLADHIRTARSTLSIKGGFLGDRLLTVADVEALAALPSREILLAKVLGGMQSPIVGLVSVLASPMRGFMGILQARMKQLEEV